MAPAEPGRRRAPAPERRAQILAAALECFASKGYHAATMDDLVRASGLSKGSLYWHFASKQEVFLALFDAVTADTFAHWDALVGEDRPALETARLAVERFVAQLGSGPALRAWIGFLAHPEARDRLAALYRGVRGRIAAGLARDRERGLVRDVPLDGAAAALTGAFEGLFLQAVVDDDFDLAHHWPVAFELLARGLRA